MRALRLAEQQGGAIADRQLLALGFSRHVIAYRVETGRLVPWLPGVYVVGGASIVRRGRWMAAVLTYGRGTLLGRHAAGMAWDVIWTDRAHIDVVVTRRCRPRRGVTPHQTRRLGPEDVDEVDGIPVTSVARTLADLAAVLTEHRLKRAWGEADKRRLLDLRAIERQLVPGRPGYAALKHRLEHGADPGPRHNRREMELRFLELCAAHGLPRPLCDVPVAADGKRYELDFLWPSHDLVVETDGRETHLTDDAFESDRERDARLLLHGLRTVRITWTQLTEKPEAVAATLRGLLAARQSIRAISTSSTATPPITNSSRSTPSTAKPQAA